ncbi:MAG: hypothetical protein J5796_01665, partial [Erysipelotrichaceae bacterium]|nr:hypothetical protein [Erysipelotrichaceae bacterium]
LSIFQGQLDKNGRFQTKFCMNDWMRAGAPIYVSLYETEEDMLEEKNAVSTAQMIPAQKAKDITVVTFLEQSEDRFTVKTTLYGVTLNLTVEGAILYGEMPSKEILLCQAKPGSKIKVKVEIAGGLPVGLLDWETVNFTWLQSGQTFEFNIGTDKEIGYFEDFSVYYDDMTLRICMLTVYPVDAYTEKPILTYEPSWSGTR